MAFVTTGLTNGGVTKHYRFSYDQALAGPGGPEPARTNAVIAACETDYTAMAGWFGGGLTVTGIEAAHDELLSRGISVSDVWHGATFPPEARLSGPDPAHTSYGSFCSFSDPDGNAWLVQEVTSRLPGRV